jgi:hypothetical protein
MMQLAEGPRGYALGGWENLNKWAVENDRTWARACLEIMSKKLNPEDSLRLLCAALLMEKHDQLWR